MRTDYKYTIYACYLLSSRYADRLDCGLYIRSNGGQCGSRAFPEDGLESGTSGGDCISTGDAGGSGKPETAEYCWMIDLHRL